MSASYLLKKEERTPGGKQLSKKRRKLRKCEKFIFEEYSPMSVVDKDEIAVDTTKVEAVTN